MFFAAIAVCAFSTAAFAGEVKEVKAEIEEVVERNAACDAAWIATYDSMIHTDGVSYEQAVAAADRTETACRNASISAE